MALRIPSIKLVILGESSVGKSSIVARYASDSFENNTDPTIGAAFLTKNCSTGTQNIKLEIWDTAGQERFHALAPMYYRNASAAIVVFDVTKYRTYERAKLWIAELKSQASSNIIITLVGNKIDLQERLRQVEKEEAGLYATESDIMYFETSAKSSTSIDDVFVEIAKRMPVDRLVTQQVIFNQNIRIAQVSTAIDTSKSSKSTSCNC
ncbi:MAG: ras family-domain-containing protein [Benjaminiella poitrasii]|nr:MAG: ras family-domain-containing protein [Benjaminiella poitrasii]